MRGFLSLKISTESNYLKKLFIGNLPGDATERSVRGLFSDFGTVRSVDLATDIFTGRCKGFCFIEMEGHEARVAIDGVGEVGALAVNCGGVGNTTMLSIRPERVLIGEGEIPNAMEALVVELIYLGDHIRCRMEVAGHDDFIVKVPNSHEHAALRVGEKTPIGWVTEDCRALDAA